jgi:Zn-dependent protease
MPGGIPLGRVGGIPINLHVSWFIIAAFITVSLGGQLQRAHADWHVGLLWVVAAGTAVLVFVTLLAHEFAHSVVARARGLPVRSITLFALGGVANIEREATSARTEFLVAVVGPITSLAIGGTCIAAAHRLGWTFDGSGRTGVAGAVLGWLGSINVVVAIFNLLPGYPLDGGRMLRALLWRVYGNAEWATRVASRVGQGVAATFIGWGLIQFILGLGFGGLWLALIGWFLMSAARASHAEVSLNRALRTSRT